MLVADFDGTVEQRPCQNLCKLPDPRGLLCELPRISAKTSFAPCGRNVGIRLNHDVTRLSYLNWAVRIGAHVCRCGRIVSNFRQMPAFIDFNDGDTLQSTWTGPMEYESLAGI